MRDGACNKRLQPKCRRESLAFWIALQGRPDVVPQGPLVGVLIAILFCGQRECSTGHGKAFPYYSGFFNLDQAAVPRQSCSWKVLRVMQRAFIPLPNDKSTDSNAKNCDVTRCLQSYDFRAVRLRGMTSGSSVAPRRRVVLCQRVSRSGLGRWLFQGAARKPRGAWRCGPTDTRRRRLFVARHCGRDRVASAHARPKKSATTAR